MKKRILAILLTLAILAVPILACAEEVTTPAEIEIIQFYSYTNSVTTTLSISSSGNATATGSITGYYGTTTSVDIFLYIQQYKNGAWVNVGSWSSIGINSYKGALSKSMSVARGYTYRVKASYYANSGSKWENIVQYSQNVYY